MTEIIDIAEQYDNISKDFDRSRVRIWNAVKDFLQPTKDNLKLLDAGCGNGKNMMYAIKHGYITKGFDISKFSIQLSTVLYIQQSQKGGELVLHKKSWKKSDEKFRNIDFGYSRDVILDCNESVKIKPNQGDLIIINPIYYHEILPVKANKRITLGLFLAFSKHGEKVVTWS